MLRRIHAIRQFNDEALLLMRITFGIVMAVAHGFPKLTNYSNLMNEFPDPIGVGSPISLGLVIFAELFCAISVSLGFLTRISLIPLIVTMIVAVFIIHGNDPFGKMELGLIYLVGYLSLLMTGPGRYSIDARIFHR